ncbi:MAG: hypothetical protein JO130_08575 [Solirubrobacterales bacterium]|nr:hypothetical protein [Solirubrobacterales bacterium]
MRLPGRHPRTPASIERDLTRLADGTLDASRREPLERLLTASPDLRADLREQRRAVAALRAAGRFEQAPVAVRVHHRALAGRARRRGPTRTVGLVGATAALLWAVVSLSGGQAALTVAQAATIAVRPVTASVAEPRDGQTALPGVRAAGLTFPYWGDRFGWRATGMRTDRLDGRPLTTVFYRRGAASIAYTIVAGPALPARLTTWTDGGRTIVTWTRRGHTCVLSGRGIPARELQRLAAW